jgi:DNA-directed RNA polymerase specialized sigma24 family protein
MEVDSELVESAKKGDRDAAVAVLAHYYPVVWRMCTGLTGRDDVGRGAAQFLMQRSLRVMHQWQGEGGATRWFHHHTVLTIRSTEKHQPDAEHDTLLGHGADRGYVAFIRALRALPIQQREAFILHHGEKLGVRESAVAMDCSVLALENHLREAWTRLRELAGEKYESYVAQMAKTYQSLEPGEELVLKDVRRRVSGYFIPRFLARIARFLVVLALIL